MCGDSLILLRLRRDRNRYVTIPWFRDDLRVVRPEFQASRANREHLQVSYSLKPTLVLVAEQFSATVTEGSQTVAAQKEGPSGPSMRWAGPM